jgi:phospholipid N-methyltransferase
MQKLKTAFEFTKNLKITGALYETSKKVENEISKNVLSDTPQIIVEFGAGHGNITRAILNKMNPNSILYAFELHTEFCDVLTKIEDKRLRVINASAQYVDAYVTEKVDCIISSIPFSFIPDEVLDDILKKSHLILSDTGTISQVLYSAYHIKKYKKYFSKVSYKILWSIPPEFIYLSKK